MGKSTILAAAFVVVCALPCQAASINLQFSGILAEASLRTFPLTNAKVGDPFTGTLFYQFAEPLPVQAAGHYDGFQVGTGQPVTGAFNFVFGNLQIASFPVSINVSLTGIHIHAFPGYPTFGRAEDPSIRLNFPLPSLALPASFDLATFQGGRIAVSWDPDKTYPGGGPCCGFVGNVTAISDAVPAPEPASLLLILGAVPLLVRAVRRRVTSSPV